jgi:hypothetical protein
MVESDPRADLPIMAFLLIALGMICAMMSAMVIHGW